MTWITAHNLSRYYRRGPNEVRALDRVDLSIDKGECVAVIGASGSGKSTLLNLLAGLDTPTAGTIRVGDQELTAVSRKELAAYRAQHVGIIFQSFNLLAHQSALKNVETALLFTDVPREERRHRAEELLGRLGMADRLDHRPADLSGGEQQRVAIARALVKQPNLILADEPTGNLDEENSIFVADLLTSLNREGLTIVIVTHDHQFAQRTAQRSLYMVYGRLVSPSSAEEVGQR